MENDDLKEVEKLEVRPFTRFCMSIGAVPSSYLAGLSIEEQLLWLCSYLEKEVIPAVNNNGEAVEELQGLYEELKTYVDNYFDNLDVQEEINTKLDKMAEDGTLTNLIRTYIDPLINQQNDIIYSLNAKVDAATSGSPAGVYATLSALQTADPDHSKIYVVLADGYWYYYSTSDSAWVQGAVYQSSETTSEIDVLKNDLTGIKNGYETFGSYSRAVVGTFVNGEYRTSPKKRVCCIDLMHFDRPITITVAEGYQCNILQFNSEGVYQTDLAYVTDTYTIPTTKYFKIMIKLVDETGAVDNPDVALFLSKVTFKTKIELRFEGIENDIDNLEDSDEQLRFSNYKFENIEYTNGKYITRINDSGYIANDEYSCATNYVEVKPNTVIKMSKLYLSGNRTCATYDSSHNTLECLTSSSSSETELIVEIGENVRYIKATGRTGICPEFEYLSISSQDDVDHYIKTNGYNDLYAQAANCPVISFIDDDTASPTYVTALKQLCDTNDIKISFAGLTSNIGDSNYQGQFIALMKNYEREGFPVIMHGYSQGDFYKAATRDLEDAEDDLVHGIQDMLDWGFVDFKAAWATPFGEYDNDLKSLALKYGFESLIRYTTQQQVEDPTKLNPLHRYEIYRFTFESTSDVATIKTLIDKAVGCNGWLLIGLHSSYEYTRGEDFPVDLAEVLSYADSQGCLVKTVNEELRRRMPIYNNYEKY